MPFGAARLSFLAKTSLTVEGVVYRSEVKITPEDTAQVDTANSKFGSASAVFDGTSDYLKATSSAFDFGTGDFTIECWVRSTVSGNQGVWQLSDDSGDYLKASSTSLAVAIRTDSSNWNYYSNGDNSSLGTSATNTWYHIALVRNSGTINFYVDGTSVNSESDTNDYSGVYLAIGGYYSTSFLLTGNIDEFRISNTARYTANFTTQTQAHENDDNTLLLLHMDGKDADVGFVDDTGYDFLLDRVAFESETAALGTSNHNDWHWKPDGTSFHAVDRSADSVYNYSLTTAFDASTATRGTSKSVSSFDLNARGIVLNPEGTIMILCGDTNNTLFEFDLSTAYDVTSWTSSSDSFALNASNTSGRGLLWNDDGTELYVLNSGATQIFAYSTTTPYSLSGMSFNTSVSNTLDNNSVIAMNWANSGYTLLVTNDSTDDLYSFRCDTPYDATTAEFRAQISMNSPSSAGVQLDETNQKLLVYDISDDDISTYSYKGLTRVGAIEEGGVLLADTNTDYSTFTSNPAEFTVAFWAKMGSGQSGDMYVMQLSTGTGGGASNAMLVRFETNGDLEIYYQSGYRYNFNVADMHITTGDNKWHHFVFSVDTAGSNDALYIDGASSGQTVGAYVVPSITQIEALGLGCAASGGAPIGTGSGVAQVAMWDTYYDLSTNIDKFYESPYGPIDLGTDGTNTGLAAPFLYHVGNTDTFDTNAGRTTGERFTYGTLTEVSSPIDSYINP